MLVELLLHGTCPSNSVTHNNISGKFKCKPAKQFMILMWYKNTRTNWPSFVASVHQVPDVCETRHSQFGQVLNVGTQDWVLSNPQSPLRLWVQQVSHPLTVDLHVGHLQGKKTAARHWDSLVDSVNVTQHFYLHWVGQVRIQVLSHSLEQVLAKLHEDVKGLKFVKKKKQMK